MADLYALECPKCGAPLEIPYHVEQLVCGHCHQSLAVKHTPDIIYLELIENLTTVKDGIDQAAAELAIQRLTRDIEQLKNQESQIQRDKKYQAYSNGCAGPLILMIGFTAFIGLFPLLFGGVLTGTHWFWLGLAAGLLVALFVSDRIAKSRQELRDRERKAALEPISQQRELKEQELKVYLRRVSFQKD